MKPGAVGARRLHPQHGRDRGPTLATFLTPEEVAYLTGARIRRKQIAVLQRNGIKHHLNAAGWPIVSRNIVDFANESSERPSWRSRALECNA